MMTRRRISRQPIATLLGSSMLIGVLMSNVTFASYPDSHDIERSSRYLIKQCNRLLYSKAEDVCAGDVGIAVSYINAATGKVRQQNYLQALTAIKYGEHELQAITKRSYCGHFSTEIKPIIEQTIRLGAEIEMLERYQRLNVVTLES